MKNVETLTLNNEQIARRVTSFTTIELVSKLALNSIINGKRMSDKSANLLENDELVAEKAKESGEIDKIMTSYIKDELVKKYKPQYPDLTRYNISVNNRVHIATESDHLFFDLEILENNDGYVIQLTNN